MADSFKESGARLQITAGQTYTNGVGYVINGIFGVALKTVASGEEAVFATEGVFELPFNASDTATRGKIAYWDDSAGEVVDASDGTDCYPIGLFWETTTDSTAEVKLAQFVNGVLMLDHAYADGATLDMSAFGGPYDIVLTVDTQAGAVEVDLPSAANMQGRRLTVIRAGTGTNAITLDQNGSETINASGTANTSLDAQHDVLTLQANLVTGWHIVSSIIA
jgi:predicted RecA/RadA family phage recombinase